MISTIDSIGFILFLLCSTTSIVCFCYAFDYMLRTIFAKREHRKAQFFYFCKYAFFTILFFVLSTNLHQIGV